MDIRWSRDDVEIVRTLGIDTPETRHLEHNLPYAQDFGPASAARHRSGHSCDLVGVLWIVVSVGVLACVIRRLV